jgi:DNA gyrase/topoisomerase IV subunit A
VQAKAIVEMRLRQLTGLEQDKLRAEYEELLSTIEDLKDILGHGLERYVVGVKPYDRRKVIQSHQVDVARTFV